MFMTQERGYMTVENGGGNGFTVPPQATLIMPAVGEHPKLLGTQPLPSIPPEMFQNGHGDTAVDVNEPFGVFPPRHLQANVIVVLFEVSK